MDEDRKEKVVISSEDIGLLEEIFGPNDPLFQPESESEPQEKQDA